MDDSSKKTVPLALVKTWLGLVRSNDVDDEVKHRALLMLRSKIGKPEEVHAYMKKHDLQ